MSKPIAQLPAYPCARARSSLSPSQSALLNQSIASLLNQVISLPPDKRDNTASCVFVSSYAKEAARQVLQSLIWEDSDKSNPSKTERAIRQRTFILADKLASHGCLDVQTLLDLGIAYAPTNSRRLRTLFASAFEAGKTSIRLSVESEVIPAFTSILSNCNSEGLYAIRKASYIIRAFLRSGPSDVVRLFSHNKPFIIALAQAYDDGLIALAQSYGGLRFSATADISTLDEWERIFLETKVALLDSFHIIVRTLLDGVAAVSLAGSALAAECEKAFDIVFALIELRRSSDRTSPQSGSQSPTPFLNRPLLADYQHAYNFAQLLASALRRADDARTELLESTLRELDAAGEGAGVLRLLLHSSGAPPGTDHRGRGTKGKDKAVELDNGVAATALIEKNPALDGAVAQVLDIFPEQDSGHVRFLLAHPDYPYKGSAERLIEALLEGAAPGFEQIEHTMIEDGLGSEPTAVPSTKDQSNNVKGGDYVYTMDRRNIFDEQKMDVSNIRMGKKSGDAHTILEDRTFIEQMKADILRRAEEISSDEDDDEDGPLERGEAENKGKARGVFVAFEEELDEDGVVKVRDGEESEETETEESEDEDKVLASAGPETILELAYIRDPKVFDRDGQTRRSKARADLIAQTGWADEQIEGWRIMLERNPKKDKILAKHEFSGNKPGMPVNQAGPSRHDGSGGRGQGRGRGGGGRGRGRGGRGGGPGHPDGTGGGGGEASARDRAWKDKNKASRGNHNRKRGHDKKMARAGGPS